MIIYWQYVTSAVGPQLQSRTTATATTAVSSLSESDGQTSSQLTGRTDKSHSSAPPHIPVKVDTEHWSSISLNIGLLFH